MKKLLPILLTSAIVASIATPAMAEVDKVGPGGKTTLETTVPNVPLYTLNIPSNQTIPYKATKTNIGKVTVSDVNEEAVGSVAVDCVWDPFQNDDNVINLAIFYDGYLDGRKVLEHKSPTGTDVQCVYVKSHDAYCDYFAEIKESDWEKAMPGKYTSYITWTSTYLPAFRNP